MAKFKMQNNLTIKLPNNILEALISDSSGMYFVSGCTLKLLSTLHTLILACKKFHTFKFTR